MLTEKKYFIIFPLSFLDFLCLDGEETIKQSGFKKFKISIEIFSLKHYIKRWKFFSEACPKWQVFQIPHVKHGSQILFSIFFFNFSDSVSKQRNFEIPLPLILSSSNSKCQILCQKELNNFK